MVVGFEFIITFYIYLLKRFFLTVSPFLIQDGYKKPSYVQISVETYSQLTGLEDQVKIRDEQIQTLEGEIKDLNEKLSAAQSEMTTKDNLVKQHAKVAEEAVSGIVLYFCGYIREINLKL